MNVRVVVDRYSCATVPGYHVRYDGRDKFIFNGDFAYVIYADGTGGIATYSEVVAAGIQPGECISESGEGWIFAVQGRVIELRALS